jgi:endonuclease III
MHTIQHWIILYYNMLCYASNPMCNCPILRYCDIANNVAHTKENFLNSCASTADI